MTQVSTRYLQTFLEIKIKEKIPAKAVKVAAKADVRDPVRRSPIGERFKQLPSQIEDLGSSSSAKVANEFKASIEPELTETELEALLNEPVANML